MTGGFVRFFLYLSLGGLIAFSFVRNARTEFHQNRYNSIVGIADGSTQLPFSKRRLLVDAASMLSTVVPASGWNAVSNTIDGSSRLTRFFRTRSKWPREHDPLLISATLLIAASAAGFIAVCRRLTMQLYEMPAAGALAVAVVLGFALQGGAGWGEYQWYPYDIPHAFIFNGALCLMLSGRRIALLAVFAAATYSKETSILLVPAYLMSVQQFRPRRDLAMVGLMIALYAAIRLMIDARFGGPPKDYFALWRNIHMVGEAALYNHWPLPIYLIAAVCIFKSWPNVPVVLRRWSFLIVVMVGICLFKGWVEELRAYTEVMPIAGLIVLQALCAQVGLSRFWSARTLGKTLSIGWTPRTLLPSAEPSAAVTA